MASNHFGKVFRITTWGESHGVAIGVVIDGCPAGVPIAEEEINQELRLRAPGKNRNTSPRQEGDEVQILSGVFEGFTTGAPISLLIPNRDADPSKYTAIKHLVRPGHANETYLDKYGLFDYRGGGRASGRETACRVAAAAIAKKLVPNIEIVAYLKTVGSITAEVARPCRESVYASEVHCPDPRATKEMVLEIQRVKEAGDSIGAVVEFTIQNPPKGLGEPVYAKLEAMLAEAMMGIPAAKGFEIGSGFACSAMQGSQHNDSCENHAGGTLGGISTGKEIIGRVAFKPTSSIMLPQQTLDLEGNPAIFQLPAGSRHDPCLAIRAVPVVEAMCALVMADAYLLSRCSRK